MRLLLAGGLAFVLAAGCARPSPADLADYGPRPIDYQDIVKRHYDQRLFDPYSAVYEFGEPNSGWLRGSVFSSPKYGWLVCGTLNAKNRFGGYVGVKPFVVLINNGRVATDILGDGDFNTALVRGTCP